MFVCLFVLFYERKTDRQTDKDIHLSTYVTFVYSYVQAGASAIKLILRNFAPVIKSNMAAPPASVGVDLVREERSVNSSI